MNEFLFQRNITAFKIAASRGHAAVVEVLAQREDVKLDYRVSTCIHRFLLRLVCPFTGRYGVHVMLNVPIYNVCMYMVIFIACVPILQH